MARSLFAGLAIVGIALSTSAFAIEGGAPACNGPDCVGTQGGPPGPGGFNRFWHNCCLDFHRNNSWPEPFLSADRMAVRAPYCIMTDNGWKMQNTVGTYLFDGESQRVNQAGDLLVK